MSLDILDDLGLGRFDKGSYLHLPSTLWAGQRINIIDSLDEHGTGPMPVGHVSGITATA